MKRPQPARGAVLAGAVCLLVAFPAPAPAEDNPKAALRDAIEAEVRKAARGGKIDIPDPRSGELLTLDLVKVHDAAHVTQDGSAYACVDFRSATGKIYDVDVFGTAEGKFRIQELLVHKAGGKDRIREPKRAEPPPPATAAKVRETIEGWMERDSALRGGQFPLYDSRAGRILAGEAGSVHQSVHVTADGLYYACADVRAEGKLYDVDVYVRPSGEDFEVVDLIVHKTDGKDRLR